MRRDTVSAPDWSTLGLPDVLARLRVDLSQGLTLTDAEARRARYGPNVLPAADDFGCLVREQATHPLALLLLAAAVVVAITGDFIAAAALIAVTLLNVLLGFLQTRRIMPAIATVRRLSTARVRVRRENQTRVIPAAQLVPGDIVFLEAGDVVPADGRLSEVADLYVQEGALTGELESAAKITAAIPGPNVELDYRRNMAFMGTTITHGRGQMVVTATGIHTQLGRVVHLAQERTTPASPLRHQIYRISHETALLALLLIAATLGLAVLRTISLQTAVGQAIRLAVALAPAGVLLTTAAALIGGARRFRAQRALICRPDAVTALGATTALAADLTGVLTENRLAIAASALTGQRFELTAPYHHSEPVILPDDPVVAPDALPLALRLLLAGCTLCNDAILRGDPGRPGHLHAVGDPKEGAQVVAAGRAGLWKGDLDAICPRVERRSACGDSRQMMTVHRVGKDACADTPFAVLFTNRFPLFPLLWLVFAKGAVEEVAARCDQVWVDDHAEPLDEAWRARLTAMCAELGGPGRTLLGLAFQIIEPELTDTFEVSPHLPADADLEHHFTLVGFIALAELPRPGAPAALAACRAAGVRPVVFSRDRSAIVQQTVATLGMAAQPVATGAQIGQMSSDMLQKALEQNSVFAESGPDHKYAVVRALQDRGHVVAATGVVLDDVLTLAAADVGVTMGAASPQVMRDLAALMLLDDDFTMLPALIVEARGVCARIQEGLRLALAGNLGRALIVLVAPLLGLPVPFTLLQLLYLSFVVDGALSIGVATSRAELAAADAPPHRFDVSLFGRAAGLRLLAGGILVGVVGLAIGVLAGTQAIHETRWNTAILTAVVAAQIFHALALRARAGESLVGRLSRSRPLLIAVGIVVAMHLIVLYLPGLNRLLGAIPLTAGELLIAFGLGSALLWAGELGRQFVRRPVA